MSRALLVALSLTVARSALGAAPLPRELLDELSQRPETTVVVTLGERPVGPANAGRRAELARVQERVLADLDPAHVRVVYRFENIGGMVVIADATGAAALAAHPDVKSLGPEEIGHASMAQSIPLIQGDAVREAGYSGAGMKVAVIDSGVSNTHLDIAPALVDEHCFCALQSSGCCPDGSYEQGGAGSARDDQDHGTLVAGILVSQGHVAPLGLVPDADLVGIRALNAEGVGALDRVAMALDWLATNHSDVDVVNVSINSLTTFSDTACDSLTPTTTLIADAVATLRSQGTITFVASGNDASAG